VAGKVERVGAAGGAVQRCGFCAGTDREETFQSRIDCVDPGANTAEGSGGLTAGLEWLALVPGSKSRVAGVNLLRECWKTPEHKQAVAAFIEKRPARFR
jgi:hypothetical protein